MAELPWGFIVASLVLVGSVELVYHVAHRRPMHEPSYMVVQTGTVFLTLAVIGVLGAGFSLTPRMAGLGVVNGLLGYATGWAQLYAIGRGPVSLTAAIRRLSFIVTGLLAVLFLGETLTAAKAVAVALAALATLVMSSGDADGGGRPHPHHRGGVGGGWLDGLRAQDRRRIGGLRRVVPHVSVGCGPPERPHDLSSKRRVSLRSLARRIAMMSGAAIAAGWPAPCWLCAEPRRWWWRPCSS